MHATEVARPFHREGIVASKAEGAVRLVSRNGRDHTRRFPEPIQTKLSLSAPPKLSLRVTDDLVECSSGRGKGHLAGL